MNKYTMELEPGRRFVGTPSLRDACLKLRPGDILLVPYYPTNAARLGNIRHEMPFRLACSHPKGSAYSLIFIVPDATSEEAALKGHFFIYLSTKTREPYPLSLFEEGGEDALYDLLRGGAVRKDYDYPLIPFGFYHNNIFHNGQMDRAELTRLETLWKEINE